MADQTDFKHITVNPAEPDDVVIHAGAPKDDAQPSEAKKGSAQLEPAAAPADKPAQPTVQASSSHKPSTPKATSSYHATTLEDIQGFKMSKTQIAVIIIALAAIVAFVVWYLVFS